MKIKETKILKMVWTDSAEIYGIIYDKSAKTHLKKESYKKYYLFYDLCTKLFVWQNGGLFYLQQFKKDKHSYDLELIKEVESYIKILDQKISAIYYPKNPNPLIFVSINENTENEMYWALAPRVE